MRTKLYQYYNKLPILYSLCLADITIRVRGNSNWKRWRGYVLIIIGLKYIASIKMVNTSFSLLSIVAINFFWWWQTQHLFVWHILYNIFDQYWIVVTGFKALIYFKMMTLCSIGTGDWYNCWELWLVLSNQSLPIILFGFGARFKTLI